MAREDFLTYFYKDSLLHRAHPLGKFLLLIICSIIIMHKSLLVLSAGFIIFGILTILSKVPLQVIARGSLFIFFITFGFRILTFLDFSVHPLSVRINVTMLIETAWYVSRIMLIFFYNALFYTTTSLSEFRNTLRSLEKRLVPGLKAHHQISLILMLFLKFIPLSIASWHELEKAWQARGGKNGFHKYYKLLPRLIERMMVKAVETAQAMILKALN